MREGGGEGLAFEGWKCVWDMGERMKGAQFNPWLFDILSSRFVSKILRSHIFSKTA